MLERLESRLGLLTSGPRDVPARQRTLRDTIDWSFNLLNEDERRLFARLGVFTGGRTIEAVEVICGPELGMDTFNGLESLLNKSLIYQKEGPGGEPRFIMLETIHEYASEKLVESGEERQIRDRHLGYYLSMAEEMEPGYRLNGQLLLLARTETEWGNMRSALHWALESGNVEYAARLVSAVDYYLKYKDRVVEGYRWFNRVLGRMEEIPRKHQGRFLLGAGRLAWVNSEQEQSKQFHRQALALSRELNDKRNEAWSLNELAGSYDLPEELEAAMQDWGQGLELFQDLDDKPGIAHAFNTMGEIARLAGDFAQAQKMYEASLAICYETGEDYRQNMMLANLAFVAYHEGDYERALDLATAMMRQRYEIGWKEWFLIGLSVMAGPLGQMGEPEKAARLLGASQAGVNVRGFDHQPSDKPEVAKYIADVRAQLDEATFEAAWAEGQAMTLEQAVAYVLGE
jgi:tetratricopeptide (TPR) repeat protein